MKVYITKDWRGIHVFAEPPKLLKCGGMPDIWSGHKLQFKITVDDLEILRGEFIERQIWWSIVNIHI